MVMYLFLYLGKCIPSACSEEDVYKGWINILIQFIQDNNNCIDTTSLSVPYMLYIPMNCHTADEEGEISIMLLCELLLCKTLIYLLNF